eukprot:958178-Pelagomonas_calceolata.AAC.2
MLYPNGWPDRMRGDTLWANGKGNAASQMASKGVMSCCCLSKAAQRKAMSPYTNGLNLSAINTETDRRGFVPVNEKMEVLDKDGKVVPGVYCIGDANGKYMLAHAASAQVFAFSSSLCAHRMATMGGGAQMHVVYLLEHSCAPMLLMFLLVYKLLVAVHSIYWRSSIVGSI